MLFLLFEIGKERYCLEVSRIIEITPVVLFKKIPHTPEYICGLFNYRGNIIPVIDLSILLTGRPSRFLFSTRVIIVDYLDPDNNHRMLGLLAEKATETIYCKEEDFKPLGIRMEGIKYLGDITYDELGMIQRLKIDELLPQEIKAASLYELREINE
ncbi:MAG TPA: chemotaxis protein CheW [Syntrophorhabdaceae bacterium]|nr:chemotaxis protein CheW [Syntrophorhabdaceae bacterium]HOL05210.1 chemotaxis protein CheW [Syntrophorhabdaceae bacterium]HON84793.1 chemotaxis protein CheW [Syntrophorhabdaceae bacterium]HPC66371.1 chemotaxis protein CheW [Syntrophorhabdaceae bacterium]HPP41013.1 chemotaxis protein CheW [Syntrophorhabdaceae bacterium]